MVQVLGHLLAALMLVLLSGCITVEDDGDGGNDRSGAERGQGAPTDNDSGEAPGAPIDIPAITDSQGEPADDVHARLEKELRAACGGEVCLDIEVAETDKNFETCAFSGNTDPPAGTRVQRGSTVTLVMGSLPCTEANGDGSSDDTDGDGTPDVLDDDADGDGVPDAEQSPS